MRSWALEVGDYAPDFMLGLETAFTRGEGRPRGSGWGGGTV